MKRWCLYSIYLMLLAVLFVACAGDAPDRQAPVVTVDVRAEETYTVGEDIIQINITASDPQGGALSFSMVDQPQRSQFQASNNYAVFNWDPISSDVTGNEPRRLIFVVKNEFNLQTERSVLVHIRPGNGLPRFLNSTSEMYDSSNQEPLVIDVRVRADDLSRVDITMPSDKSPQGATFAMTGNFEGRFSWAPSAEQLKKRMHSVTFMAQAPGGQGPAVEHRITIVIRQKDSGTVGGTIGGGSGTSGGSSSACEPENAILHTPLPSQRGLQNYAVEAQLAASAQPYYSTMHLYWSSEDPLNDQQTRFESVEMQRNGDTFRANIPNPVLQSWESKVFYYIICAFSEISEDAEDEGAYICTPSSIAHSFVAYAPDETRCISPTSDTVNSASNAARISDLLWENYQLCQPHENFHFLDVRPGEIADIFALYNFGQDIGVQFYDAQMNPVEFYRAECTGYASLSVDNSQGSQTERFYLKVSGHDLVYQVTAFVEGGSGSTEPDQPDGGDEPSSQCNGTQYEPNDTAAEATVINQSNAIIEAGICSVEDIDVFRIELNALDRLNVQLDFKHADGDLELTLFAPSQAASVTQDSMGVARSWTTTDNESLSYLAQETGTFFLRVHSHDTPNNYTLHIQVVPGSSSPDEPSSCNDSDQFSGNHSRDSAATIVFDQDYNNLKLCPLQPNWYKFNAQAGEYIWSVIQLHGGVDSEDVIFEAFNTSSVSLATGKSVGNEVELEFEAPYSGTYYLEVWADGPLTFELNLYRF